MGYNVKFSGKLLIAEPFVINRNTPRPAFELGREADLQLFTRKTEIEVPDVGTATVTKAAGFIPPDSDRMGYTEKDIEVAAKWTAEQGGTHLTGFILITGEDNDIWRWRVDEDGKPIQETPKLLWPNGDVTEHESR